MNQKKTYSKIKDISLKTGNFLDKNGFYLVIFLCIIVIGATIAVVSIRDYQKLKINIVSEPKTTAKVDTEDLNIKKTEEPAAQTVIGKVTERPKSKDRVIVLNNKNNISAKEKELSSIIRANSTKNNDKPNKKVQKTNKVTPQKSNNVQDSDKPLSFDWPVFGKIINGYAKDSLIFSKTLQQWTTHEGVDIASKEGTPVRTAADGIIKSIKIDPIYGITIIIEHKNGTKTVYSNLSSGKMVKAGQFVKRAKVISGVGRTAGFECEEEAHLHFEIIKNEKNVNPDGYLPSI